MLPEKTTIRLNASSLPWTKCMLQYHRHVVQGYKEPRQKAAIIYGTSFHKYVDTMFKTNGRIDLAREAALLAFRVPKIEDKSKSYLLDEGHLIVTCMNAWDDYIKKDNSFEHLMMPDGRPATEVTFSIRYYEDDTIIVNLEGTTDKIGRIKGGCFALGDYKTTSSRDGNYCADYEMSYQLRFYVLSFKLMAQLHPDSMLGQVGATRLGAFIDAIFVNRKLQDNTYERSDVFQFSDDDLAEFRSLLDKTILKISAAIRTESWKRREGIVTGACSQKFNTKCPFWFVCKSNNPAIQELMLKRDFIQKPYDPLHHND